VAALGSAAWQGTKALPGKIVDGVADCASQPLSCAVGVASNLLPAVVAGFKDAGTSLGGALAATLDETTSNHLKQLYGSENAPKVVGAIAASPAAAMVLPAEKLLAGGGKVVEKGLDAVGQAWEAGKVLGTGEVKLSRGGNISAQQITKEGTPAALNATETAELAKLASLDSNAAGTLRETVANSYFERNGFQALDGKCGSNCFDGVYIKGDQVIVNEVKPLNADGSIRLNPADGNLPTQGTVEWVESRADALIRSGDPDKIKTGNLIIQAKEAGKLTTVISGVNGNGMVVVKVKP
jgi:hypothetical protein